MNSLWNFYGIDWLAMVLTFFCLYALGDKKRYGFLLGAIANVCWLIFGLLAGSIANTIANFVFIFINLRGYIKWEEVDCEKILREKNKKLKQNGEKSDN